MSSVGYREKCLKEKGDACFVCDKERKIVVHHIDHDRSNNDIDNLVPLCYGCHRKVHSDNDHGKPISHLQKQLEESNGKSSISVSNTTKSELIEFRAVLEAEELRDISQGEALKRCSELALVHLRECSEGEHNG